jgi:hypothetical protein
MLDPRAAGLKPSIVRLTPAGWKTRSLGWVMSNTGALIFLKTSSSVLPFGEANHRHDLADHLRIGGCPFVGLKRAHGGPGDHHELRDESRNIWPAGGRFEGGGCRGSGAPARESGGCGLNLSSDKMMRDRSGQRQGPYERTAGPPRPRAASDDDGHVPAPETWLLSFPLSEPQRRLEIRLALWPFSFENPARHSFASVRRYDGAR